MRIPLPTDPDLKYSAGDDLYNGRYRFVRLSGNDSVALVTEAGGDADGILQNNPNGFSARVRHSGNSLLLINSSVSQGDELVSDNAGRGVLRSLQQQHPAAIALEAGESGDIIPVQLLPQIVADADAQQQNDAVVYVSTSGDDDSGDGSLNFPVRSFDRAWELLDSDWRRSFVISLAPGTRESPAVYNWTNPTLMLGAASGSLAAPLIIQGGFTNELGTRAATSASTTSNIVDTSLASTIRSGSAATFTTGAPAGQIRLTGLTDMTSADVDRMLMIRLGASAGNNGCFTIATVNSATSVDLINPQGVTGDANNGGIYWQETWEGGFISFSTGALAGQRRMIRDHGVEATGTITCVAVASLLDNDNFFVPDGNGAGVTFEFHVTGGYVAVPGRVEIDVSAMTTDAQVAAAVATAINAQLVSALRVRATNTAGSAVVQVKNMMLGTVGNVSITEAVADAGFLVSGFTGGVGAPLNTFSVNDLFTAPPAVGDSFQIERPAATVVYNNRNGISPLIGAPSFFEGSGSSMYVRGVRFLNGAGSTASLGFVGVKVHMEGCEIAGRASTIAIPQTTRATAIIGGFTASAEYNNLYDVVFPVLPAVLGGGVPDSAGDPSVRPAMFTTRLRFQAGIFLRDISSANGMNLNPLCGIHGYFVMRNVLVASTVGGVAIVLNTPDCKRTTFNCGSGTTFSIFGNPSYPSRLDGQQTASSTTGILTLRRNVAALIFSVNISNSAGHGIHVFEDAMAHLFNALPLSGTGNAGYGLSCVTRGGMVVPASGANITGALGDMKVGMLAARSWSNFYGTAPIGNQSDYRGDGSRIVTNTSTHKMGESRSGIITAGNAFADITFGAGLNGAPVQAQLNTVDGTATEVLSAVWQGSNVLRVTVNAAATGDVTVSAFAAHAVV